MTSALYPHEPVMVEEALTWLNVRPDGVYVDATAGAGGHSECIARRLETGRLIAIDRDPAAVALARRRLAPYPGAIVVHGNYSDLAAIVREQKFESVHGVLLDAGVSSMQLDSPERGFSFQTDGPLDMRMDTTAPLDAAGWLARAGQEEIRRVLREYGDVGPAGRIARAIVERRAANRMQRTADLAAAVSEALHFVSSTPSEVRTVFQAVRMAVNEELHHLEAGLRAASELLAPQGRLVVITFHSGEDRVAKHLFRALARPRVELLPDGRVFDRQLAMFDVLTREPVVPTQEEIQRNSRAKSARIRVLERKASEEAC